MKKIGGFLLSIVSGCIIVFSVLWMIDKYDTNTLVMAADNIGKFQKMVIQFTSETLPVFRDTFTDLLKSLSKETEFSVVCKDKNEWEKFLSFLNEINISADNYKPCFTGKKITSWAKDRYVLCMKNKKTVLFAPLPEKLTSKPRENEFYVPDVIADNNSGVEVIRPKFRFDGGDFLAAENTIICGAGIVYKNMGGQYRESEALKKSVFNRFAIKIIALGEKYDVPKHHAGILLTPLNDKKVLVGDPTLAEKILSTNIKNTDFSKERQEQFNNLKKRFNEEGFEVISLPIVPFKSEGVYITYNNVLMEEYDNKKIVYMPVYDIPELDNYSASVYENFGYTVKRIRVKNIYQLGGTVRCVFNILDKS